MNNINNLSSDLKCVFIFGPDTGVDGHRELTAMVPQFSLNQPHHCSSLCVVRRGGPQVIQCWKI